MVFMQPVPFLGYRNIPLVTAPFIGIDFIRQSHSHRIAVNISNRLQQVAVRIDKNGLVASSEKLAVALMATIVSLSVNAVQVAHAS